MRVSFDYDGTLSRKSVRKYAKELNLRGIECWICTARYNDHNSILYFGREGLNAPLYRDAKYCRIPMDRIIFTEMKPKNNSLIKIGALWHLDDDDEVLMDLLEIKPPIGINVKENNWKEECDKLIGKYEWINKNLSIKI